MPEARRAIRYLRCVRSSAADAIGKSAIVEHLGKLRRLLFNPGYKYKDGIIIAIKYLQDKHEIYNPDFLPEEFTID